MILGKLKLSESSRSKHIQHCYAVIGCMQQVHTQLGPALPEYVYQEALYLSLRDLGLDVKREYVHHPVFNQQPLESYIKMDLVVFLPEGNIIIECKSISEIGNREQLQTYGYLCGTGFPYAILVNFGTYPKAEIERYYHEDEHIVAF